MQHPAFLGRTQKSKSVLALGSRETPFKLGRQTIVFSTQSSSYLADLIAAELQVARGTVIRESTHNEVYYRLEIPDYLYLMGKDVIFVGALASDADLLDTMRIGCALADAGTRRRLFVIPFLGCSTMDRGEKPGEVVVAKAHALMLSSIPNTQMGNMFAFLDLHIEGLLHYFEGPSTRLMVRAGDLLEAAVRRLELPEFMIGAVDLGQPKVVETFAGRFNTDIAFLRSLPGDDTTSEIIGSVKGRVVLLYDDMVRSGKTMIHAAERYIANGATSVYAVVSHCALDNEEAIDGLVKSPLIKIITTNSHPMSQHPHVQLSPKFEILDVSWLFEAVIRGQRIVRA